MPTTPIRDAAQHILDPLPEDATWDDLMNEIYVRQAIERGLEDSRAGRVLFLARVRARFGMAP